MDVQQLKHVEHVAGNHDEYDEQCFYCRRQRDDFYRRSPFVQRAMAGLLPAKALAIEVVL